MNHKSDVPYLMHEADMARMERTNKRIAIALCISIAVNALLVITKRK